MTMPTATDDLARIDEHLAFHADATPDECLACIEQVGTPEPMTTDTKPETRTWRCEACGETWTVRNKVGPVAGMATVLASHNHNKHDRKADFAEVLR